MEFGVWSSEFRVWGSEFGGVARGTSFNRPLSESVPPLRYLLRVSVVNSFSGVHCSPFTVRDSAVTY